MSRAFVSESDSDDDPGMRPAGKISRPLSTTWRCLTAGALKGKVVGDTVAIALPGGERILKILSIVQE